MKNKYLVLNQPGKFERKENTIDLKLSKGEALVKIKNKKEANEVESVVANEVAKLKKDSYIIPIILRNHLMFI